MKQSYIIILIISILLTSILIVGGIILNQKKFGKLPSGKRLERIEKSPNYNNGKFTNIQPTQFLITSDGLFGAILDFLFGKHPDLRPDSTIEAIKTNLHNINFDEDFFIWFGHSSYLLQINAKKYLIDPVFFDASPFSFVNTPFKGSNIYKPDDMPDIDYLIITHDHWDHLDYKTVTQLKERIKHVICPLGVGEHFEYWGFNSQQIIEMDWNEHTNLDSNININCLPARHFSGRGLKSNKTLWASFVLQTPGFNVFIGGDGGYGKQFAQIGKQFPCINLAILENGQYNMNWKYVHTLPMYLKQETTDLNAQQIITVHHSKYSLAPHPWYEPLNNEKELLHDSVNITIPIIGEIVLINSQKP